MPIQRLGIKALIYIAQLLVSDDLATLRAAIVICCHPGLASPTVWSVNQAHASLKR